MQLRKAQLAGREQKSIQLTIPKYMCKKIGIKPGGYVKVKLEGSSIIICPLKNEE